MLSDRMREWAKSSPHPNSDITVEDLAIMDNQSTLIFAEEVAALEAQLQAHLENEGDECPLCVAEAQVARLREALEKQYPEHWCGRQGYGLGNDDFCPACEKQLALEALDD